MIKYFLVNNATRAAAYGIGTYVKQMASILMQKSSQYEICLLDLHSDVKEFTIREESDGIKHYCVPVPQGRGNALLYYKSILFWLDSFLQENEPVIFHFNYSQHFDLIKLLKAKYTKSHILYTIHYLKWCFSLNGNLSRFKALIAGKNPDDEKMSSVQNDFGNDKRLFSLCDDVIVLSKFTYKLLKEYYKINSSKIHLIYNGMKEDDSITKYSGQRSSPKEILFVGRLDESKGVEFIIKAFKKLYEKHKDIHLTFVGDGNFGQYLPMCENVWDKVTFTGKIPREKLEQFFCKATIGVLPSFNEQCSYTAIEMMAHGIPLVATDSTGLGEMMDFTPENMIPIDEKDFDPDSFVEKLAQKMDILLSDAGLRKSTSEKLLGLFQERHHLNCMKTSMNFLFEKNNRQNEFLSSDFLPYLDEECIRLVNDRPSMDMDFIGLTGVGCYLWWRIETLMQQKRKRSLATVERLQKYLVYYIDWVSEVIYREDRDVFSQQFDPKPFDWLFYKLLQCELYKTKVQEIIYETSRQGIDFGETRIKELRTNEILRTALKIYNSNF